MRIILLFVLFTVSVFGFAQNQNSVALVNRVNVSNANEYSHQTLHQTTNSNSIAITESCTPTLSTGAVNGSPICAGSVITVSYTFIDCVDAANIFSVELSDAVGSFTSPTVIGTLASTSSGSISSSIPATIATVGSAYRIRVVASSPATIGSDNGTDLTIIPKPNAGFVINAIAQCITNNNFIFSNTSTGSITGFNWDLGDGKTFTTNNAIDTYLVAGNYNVKLVVTGSNSCKDSITKTVSVNSKPVSNFSITNSSLCQGENFNFTNNSSIAFGSISYLWNFGDATSVSSINANHIYNAGGNFDVKLIALSNGGCIDSITKTVNVLPNETALFTANSLTQCGTNNFVFTNNTSGVTSSLWSFGDGITSTVTSPAKNYASNGIYVVKLVVTNFNGCKDSTTKTVTVLSKPTAAFTIVGTTNCSSNSTFTFNNTSTGVGNTYFWSFGDGNTTSAFSPSNTYSLEGTYTVQLVVVGSNGCRDSISKSVTFSSNAAASFTINNATQCLGANNFVFTNTSNGNVVNSNWNFGDGITSTVTSPAKNYTVAGNYAVKLVVTNSNGCKDSITHNVSVSTAPIVGFTTSGVVNCTNNLTIQNNNTTANATSYLWSFGDGSNSTAVSPSHTYTAAGTYTIKLVATNANGCSDSTSHTITFTPNPVATFTITNAVQCLSGNSFVPNNTSANGLTYLWSFGDGTTSTSVTPAKTYLTNGNYIIKLIVTNANGCKDSVSNAVAVLRSPKAAFTATYQPCNSVSVQFAQIDTSATKFSVWYFGDGNAVNDVFKPLYIYSSFGTYTVKYYAYDATSTCIDSATKTITLSSNPAAGIHNSTSNKQCLNGNSFNFSSNSLFATSYSWTFGDGSTSTAANPPAKTYNNAGIYTVKLTVANNSGCTGSTTIIDTVLSSPKANFNVIYQTCNRSNVRFIQIDTTNTKYSAWDFGDGNGASDVFNTIHSYASINSFNIKYYAYDTNFYCVDSASKTITFSDIPAAGIGFPYTSKQCLNGNSFAHTNTSIGATNYLWEFGDGSTSTAAIPPAKTFNAPGIYTVKLTVFNASGCTGSTTVLDTVLPSPKAAFTASFQTCNNLNVQFAQINTLATQWSYLNFGDGKDTVDLFNVSHLYATSGSYTVKYFAYDSNFYCSDSAVKVITLNPKPTAGITYLSSMNLVQCSNNNSFTFFDASSNAISYQWSFGDGTTSTAPNPTTHSYNAAGTYIVKQVVTGTSGCKDSTTVSVQIVQSPKAAFTAIYNACNNLTVQFDQTNAANTPLSTWDFGDGNSTIDVHNTSHTYSSVGSYTVTYYAFNTTPVYCEDIATKVITFSSNPTAAFTTTNATQCLNGNAFNFNNTSLNGVSYLWYFGDGSFSTQQTPSPKTYTNAGTYIVKQIVTNASGCKDSVSHTVTALQSPKAAFTASFNVCNNLTIQFAQTDVTNTMFSAWDFGDGNGASDVFSASHIYSTTGTYIVKYYAYDASFTCVDSATKTITLSPKPTADFTFNSLPQCVNNNSINFINTSSNATSYIWAFGDGSFSFATNPIVTYTGVGNYIVKLIVTNSNGCKDSTTRTINILPKPVPTFNIIGNTLCSSNLSVSLDNTTTGVGNTYLWSFGDGDISTAASVTKVYAAYGIYNIKLVVTSGAGCKDSLTKQVTFTAKPNATFSFTSNNQCVNPVFSFTNSSANYISSNWNFGDGSLSTQNSPAHTYTNTGIFTIKLIVTNANGCKDSATSTITVNAKPTAGFSVVGLTNCTTTKTISITNNSIGGATYFYDFGDGTNSSFQNPTKTYSAVGTYIIKQVVTNSNGCKDSTTQSITFSNTPTALFSVNNNSQCIGSNSFVFTNNSSNIASSIWSFGDGTAATQNSPTHIYTSAATFAVKLIVTNINGCKDSTSTNVTTLAKPASLFSFTGITGCTNNRTISIVDASINAATYNYDFGDGTSSSFQNPTKTYSAAGTYIVKQIVTNANGCKDSSIQTITFAGLASAAFTAIPNATCTSGSNVVITNNSTNATIYNWSFGDGTNSSSPNPIKTYITSGIFTIKLVVSNAGGCKDSTTQTVTIVAKPVASFNIPNFSNCSNSKTFSFNNTSINAITYAWSFGDGATSTQTSPTYTYAATGTYNVKLVVTNSNGCMDSMIRTISFLIKPSASFTTTTSTSCTNSFTFNNTSVNNAASATYLWTFGDATFSFLQSPIKAYTNAGTYTVTLIVTNSNGCKDTTSQIVTVAPKPFAAFTLVSFNSCNNSNTITAQSTSTNIANLSWNFGDGTNATGALVSKTYAAAGTYTITLVVTNANGCMDSTSKTITLSAKPTASFTVNNATQCANNNTYSFTNTSSISNGTLQYIWQFGDGTTSTQLNATKVYSNAGTYTVKLIATNTNTSCSDTSTSTVTVLAKPNAQFTVATSLCTNSKTIAFNNTSTNVSNISWSFGDGNTSLAYSPTNTYTNNGTYTVSLAVKNAGGCSDTLSRVINIAALPTASFNVNNNAQCFTGNSFSFTNNSTNGINYAWSFGDGVGVTTTNPTHNYTNAGNYVARLIVTNVNGCADSATTNIVVNASPTANFSYSGATSCTNNLTLNLSNASSNATSYIWDFGDGVSTNTASPNHTYSTAGTYTITLTANHSNGCSNVATQTVTFTSNPTSAFTVVGGSQCVTNNSYSFTNSSTNATSYLWSFGDGVTSTSNSPTHSYTNAGTFTVTLTTSNGNSCTASSSSTVTVVAKPTAAFSLNNFNACASGNTVSILNTSTGATNYSWDYGNGVLSNLTNPTITYSTAGTYTITLTASNSNGCSDTTSQTVTTVTKPISAFTIVGGTQCVTNNFYSFNDNSTNASSYAWSFGDGATSTSSNPTHSYTTAGTYTVTLVVTSINGCTASNSSTVTVVAKPMASFNLNSFNACANGNTVALTNTSTGATNYSWDFGNGVLSNQTNPTVTYSTVGTYTITLTVTNSNGCRDVTTQTVTTISKPISSFTLVNNATQCVGNNSYSFVNNSINASSYVWNFGDGITSTSNSPTHTYSGSGIFTVTLTVSNGAGCSSSSTATVTVLAKPSASFNLSNYNACTNNYTISPTNTSTNASSYVWDFGDGILTTQTNPTHTYTNAGVYVVTLIASNNNGCIDTTKQNITITNKPTSLFAIGGNSNQCINGNNFVFVNYSTNASNYAWSFGDGATATIANTTHTYTSAGTYTITLTVTSASGCSASSSQTIAVNNKPDAAFTINNNNQCINGNAFVFTNISVNLSGVSYVWNFGDSNYTTQTNAIKTYANAGLYRVVLTATNSNGCVDSVIKYVTVNTKPTAAFVYNNRQCTDTAISFTNKTTGTTASYIWRFGDGTTTINSNPTHVYTTAGIYTVTLVAVNDGNCRDSISETILIGNKPTANFAITSLNNCAGLFSFSNGSTGNIITNLWSFGDLSYDVNTNSIHTYNNAGNYAAKLYVATAPGCADSIIKSVTVLPKPNVSYTQSAVLNCFEGNNFTFTSTSTAGTLALSNAWNFGDGTTANGTTVTKSYSSPGTFNVKLVSTIIATGCKDSITQLVTIYPKPSATITGSIAVCKGTSAILPIIFTGTPPFSFTYNDGNVNKTISNINTTTYNLVVVPDFTTTYRLIQVKDALCVANEADLPSNATVTINTLTFTKQPDSINTCLGKNVIFSSTAFSNASFTYQWFKNGIAIPGATTDSLVLANVSTLDNGYYKLAAVLNCGSFTSNTVTLKVDPLPPPPAYVSNYTYCQYDTAKPLVATGSIIKWYDNAVNGVGSIIAPIPPTQLPGTYQYWVTNTTLPTCETPRFAVTTIVLPAPTITAKVTGPMVLIPTQTTTLTATASASAVGIKWYRNGNYIGLTPNDKVVVDFTNAGNYFAEAITADGCKARTDSIVIVANKGLPPSGNTNNILLYPNPTRSFINMYFNNPVNEDVKIRIVNSVGQVLKEVPFKYVVPNQIVKLDVNGLHPEMYVVEVINHLGTTIARNLFVKLD